MRDEELMMEVKAGKISHLSTLFQRHHRKVYDYLYKMTRDRALSDDLVQDAFERILLKKHTYQSSFPFVGWTLIITKHLLMDHYRKNRLQLVDLENHDESTSPLGVHEPSTIELALSHLKPEFREVLVLTRYEGMKYQQVAEIIGISETGVKTRVHRAIKELKEAYLKLCPA